MTMTWHSVYYGSWKEPCGVVTVWKGYGRKAAQEVAQMTADRTGRIVTIKAERPTGRGLASDFIEVAPKDAQSRETEERGRA